MIFQLNTRLKEEQDSMNRSMRDVDARLTAISARITQQVQSECYRPRIEQICRKKRLIVIWHFNTFFKKPHRL